jgi:hypothetical protein
LIGCGDDAPTPAAPEVEKEWISLIDENAAFDDLKEFAAIGGISHAPYRMDNIRGARRLIKKKLRGAGIKKWRNDVFKQTVPVRGGDGTREVLMENIVGVLPGESTQAILIGCHYDTKILPENEYFEGANDGCSAVALTIEVARCLVEKHRTEKPKFTYYFAFFDGEEAFYDWHHTQDGTEPDNTYGSRRMAADRARYPVECVIILDMIADKDLLLANDTNSNAALKTIFFEESKSVFGIDIFGPPQQILDDHVSFKLAGMDRVIDLIDLNYGPGNSLWHTTNDRVENCSAESLARVGTLVLSALPRVNSWLQGELK